MATLHITNGDFAAQIMRKAGIEGEILPWRDLLHVGPVPPNLSLNEMSEIRAEFIASKNWGVFDDVRKQFQERDNILTDFRRFSNIVLWFEHDLYDQLQLVQILAWFATQDLEDIDLQLICTENYLGTLTPDEMWNLQQHCAPVTYEQIVISTTMWQIFTMENPLELQNLLRQDTKCLPYLEGAVERILSEFPNSRTGLSLTQTIILKELNKEDLVFWELFENYAKQEERRFMADTVFADILNQMMLFEKPIIAYTDNQATIPPSKSHQFSITADGKRFIDGSEKWNGLAQADYWVGGTHLTAQNMWLWDAENKKIIKSDERG